MFSFDVMLVYSYLQAECACLLRIMPVLDGKALFIELIVGRISRLQGFLSTSFSESDGFRTPVELLLVIGAGFVYLLLWRLVADECFTYLPGHKIHIYNLIPAQFLTSKAPLNYKQNVFKAKCEQKTLVRKP